MPDPGKPTMSRREFGRSAAAVTALTMLPAWAAPALPQENTAPSVEPPKEASVPAESPSAEAEALAGIVKLRYGSRLSDADLKEITRSLDGGLKTGAALRKVPLENSDAPAFVFAAWRAEHA
jgi:hypothetical protein